MIFQSEIIKVSANGTFARKHWTYRDKINKQFLLLIKKLRLKETFQNPVDLTFNFYFKGRLLDCSNCSAMAKMIEDALVKVGVLKNDSPKFVKKVSYTSQKGIKDFVEVEIL